jgi:hypothetical protein
VAAKNRRILESATGQPAVESPERVPDRQTWPALLRFGRTISDNGLLCQREVGFQAELDVASSREVMRVFTLAGCRRGQKQSLSAGTSIRRGMSFFPQTKVLDSRPCVS